MFFRFFKIQDLKSQKWKDENFLLSWEERVLVHEATFFFLFLSDTDAIDMCHWSVFSTQVDFIDDSNLLTVQVSRLAECLGNMLIFRWAGKLWPCSYTSWLIVGEVMEFSNFDASVNGVIHHLIRKLSVKFIQTLYTKTQVSFNLVIISCSDKFLDVLVTSMRSITFN